MDASGQQHVPQPLQLSHQLDLGHGQQRKLSLELFVRILFGFQLLFQELDLRPSRHAIKRVVQHKLVRRQHQHLVSSQLTNHIAQPVHLLLTLSQRQLGFPQRSQQFLSRHLFHIRLGILFSLFFSLHIIITTNISVSFKSPPSVLTPLQLDPVSDGFRLSILSLHHRPLKLALHNPKPCFQLGHFFFSPFRSRLCSHLGLGHRFQLSFHLGIRLQQLLDLLPPHLISSQSPNQSPNLSCRVLAPLLHRHRQARICLYRCRNTCLGKRNLRLHQQILEPMVLLHHLGKLILQPGLGFLCRFHLAHQILHTAFETHVLLHDSPMPGGHFPDLFLRNPQVSFQVLNLLPQNRIHLPSLSQRRT